MITILMATCNGEKYIAEQIESILQQTKREWQLVIQDDCSRDNTAKIACTYAEKYAGQILFQQRHTPSGSAKNNFCSMLAYADGEYIMTCDQDDIWLPRKIEVTLQKMHELEMKHGSQKPLLVHTDLAVVDNELNSLAPSLFRKQILSAYRDGFNHLLVQNIVTGCTMMVNRALLTEIVTVPGKAIMHDWWFALFAAAFGEIGYVNEPTILYRQHGKNAVGAKNARSLVYNLKRIVQSEETKGSLLKTYRQAERFWEMYGNRLSPAQAEINQAFTSLSSRGKLERIQIIIKYDFWKTGIARKCGQLLFG